MYTKVHKIVTIKYNTIITMNDYIHCINRAKETVLKFMQRSWFIWLLTYTTTKVMWIVNFARNHLQPIRYGQIVIN